jgi:HK97 family phage portal protein
VIELFSPVQRRSGLANPDGWLVDMFGGPTSKTGLRINPDTALAVSAVFACVSVRSSTLAALPLKLFRTKPNGDKEPATDHPLYPLLNTSPHPDLTRFEFIEMMGGHSDLRGNCYAQIVRNNGGRIVRLVPLHPDRVTVRRSSTITADGRRPLIYEVTNVGLGGTVKLEASDILHVRDFGGDGIVGYSRIRVACEAIGLAMAADEHAARMFSNGARPAGVLEHPQKLDDPGRRSLRESWQNIHGGVGNAGKVAILEEGMKFHEVGLTNEDAQLLESRKYSRAEIASIFSVPPDRIGAESSSSTYANVEQRQIQFMLDCVIPMTERWQQRLALSLLTEKEQRTHYFKFNLASLVRGSLLDQYNAFRIGLGRAGEPGWISVNDIREVLDLNRVPGGDKLYTGAQSNDKLARATLRPLFVDAIARALRKEAKAVRAIVKRADAAAELEKFYVDHRRHLIEVVAPLADALRELGTASVPDPAVVAGQLIDESRSDLGASPVDGAALESTLLAWETTRAARTASQIIETT